MIRATDATTEFTDRSNATQREGGTHSPDRTNDRATRRHHAVGRLQRRIGNQAIQRQAGGTEDRMCPRCRRRAREGKPLNCSDCEAHLQRATASEIDASENTARTGIPVGDPNSRYEREAERVANAVMRIPASTTPIHENQTLTAAPEHVQRMCKRCSNRLAAGQSLNCTECEAELQRKPAHCDTAPTGLSDGTTEAGPSPRPTAGAVARGTGRPLPARIRGSLEPRFGYDFDTVRIHTGPRAATLAQSLNARAFTYGNDVFFDRGEYRPTTRPGRKLLSHELTHTIQQGAVEPRAPTGNTARPSDTTDTDNPHPAPRNPGRFDRAEARPRVPGSSRQVAPIATSTTTARVQRQDDQGWLDWATGRASEAGSALWDWGESSVETVQATTRDLLQGAWNQAQALANALGADLRRENGTIILTARDVTVPSEFSLPTVDLLTIEEELPFLKGAATTGAVTFIGTASLSTAFDSEAHGRLGNVHLHSLRVEIDPFGPSVRSQGRVTIPTEIGLDAELRVGVGGDLRVVITIPSEPPIAVVLPSVGLSGGIAGRGEAAAVQEVTYAGASRASLWNLSFSATQSWRSDLNLDIGIAGWGALEVEDYHLCRLYWPFWSTNLHATLTHSAGLALQAGTDGFDVDLDMAQPSIDDIGTGELSAEAERNLLEDECPLCDVFSQLGWLPSQSGQLDKYYLTTPLDGPLDVYPWDPGFASGAKCRGACGPDCQYCEGPQTRIEYGEDEAGRPVIWRYHRFFACPTHAGCRDHDACYDWTMGDSWIEQPFGIYGPLHRLCDLECICDHSLPECIGWLGGQGGDDTMYFAETVDSEVQMSELPGDETAEGIQVCARPLDIPGFRDFSFLQNIRHAFIHDPPYTYAIRDLLAGNGVTESCARKRLHSPPPDDPATSTCIPCVPPPGQTVEDVSACLRGTHAAYPSPNRYRNLPDPEDGFRPGPNSNSYAAEMAVTCCHNIGPSRFGPAGLGVLWGWNHSPAGPCRLPTDDGDREQEPQGDGTISPATVIQGPTELWYFNDETPPNYDVSATLDSNRSGGTYEWSATRELRLSSATAATPEVTAQMASTRPRDAWVTLRHTADDGSTTTDTHQVTVLSPDSLAHLRNVDSADATWGYETEIHYRIEDQFGDTLPNLVPINEEWTSGVTADFPGMDWRRGPEGAATVDPDDWFDRVQGELSNHTPSPVGPGHAAAGVSVYHWAGDWFVGSLTIGDGSRVASVTWQKYRGFARHL